MENLKKLAMNKKDAEPLMEQFREEYNQWKTQIKNNKAGFFMIYNTFLTRGMKNIAVTRSNRKVPNFILELELRCI